MPGLRAALVRRAVEAVWRTYGGPPCGPVEVVFLDAAEHTEVHADFLGDPAETDVMAFPYGDEDLHGEILVNRDLAVREARRRRREATVEALLYVVHGALHLLGFADRCAAARREMRRAEERILSGLLEGGPQDLV